MAKKQRGGRKRRRKQAAAKDRPAPARPRSRGRLFGWLRSAADGLLHRQASEGPLWRWFWPVLALAFCARAAVALSGDFIMHPDEAMQLLEPAHRLAFGSGVIYWEWFYGARSWLLPGLIAGLLKGFDALGLGQPFWYVGGVKLALCGLSLAIPVSMYFFARRHFGETAARAALLAGTFWYELVGFAHKPLSGLVATALILWLLALCLRIPAGVKGESKGEAQGLPVVWLAAFLAVLATAIRLQYAPLALALLGLCFVRLGNAAKAHLTLAAAAFFLAVGAFDAVSWDGGLFHSYLTIINFNFELRQTAASGENPAHQYLWWLLLASMGGSALCIGAALRRLRRYGFLLLLIALVLIFHSAQAHKEYRYIFVLIPLWLLLGAAVLTQLAAGLRRPTLAYGLVGTVFTALSLAGILNALPGQEQVYRGPHQPPEVVVRFLRGQDPHFAAFRYLAQAPGVAAVWAPGRHYFTLPSYYYLHRRIPFYDASTGRDKNLNQNLETLHASVSHFVTEDTQLEIPGYAVEKEFGTVRILRREQNDAPVRQWRSYTPMPIASFELVQTIMQTIDPNAPVPPPDSEIKFAE